MWLPQTATQLTRLKLGSGIAPATSSRLPRGWSPRGLLHGAVYNYTTMAAGTTGGHTYAVFLRGLCGGGNPPAR
eukprot:2826429-Pyramimonas_sp.AAC.1